MPERRKAAPAADPAVESCFEQAPMGVALYVPPGVIAWVNKSFLSLTGHDGPLVGKTLPEAGGLGSPAILQAAETALRTGGSKFIAGVHPPQREPGVQIDIHVWSVRLPSSGESGALLMLTEATERRREQEKARLFHEAFMSSTNAMEITDKKGVLVDVNPSFERIYGYTRAECIGRKPNLVRSRDTPLEVFDQLWKDLLDPARGYWSGEIVNRDRKGRERPVLLTITAIRDESGATTHYLGVAVDLTERRAWERSAAHGEKLAALGQLAAGVAHEINTPLANVMLVAESLKRRSKDPWVLSRVDTITGQVDVAAKIVRGLLDFARRSEPQFTHLDLCDVVREGVGFLRGKQSPGVEVEERYPAEPLLISGDRGQLLQVVINVLNNAYDVLEDGGKIWVELTAHEANVQLEITDSGPGIAEEDLPRIFEPFFTTKGEGKGTGLGLSIVHGIVQSHHGNVIARNKPGLGASFLFTFPRAPLTRTSSLVPTPKVKPA